MTAGFPSISVLGCGPCACGLVASVVAKRSGGFVFKGQRVP